MYAEHDTLENGDHVFSCMMMSAEQFELMFFALVNYANLLDSEKRCKIKTHRSFTNIEQLHKLQKVSDMIDKMGPTYAYIKPRLQLMPDDEN